MRTEIIPLSGLAAVKRVKPFLNQGTLITLYHSLMGSRVALI